MRLVPLVLTLGLSASILLAADPKPAPPTSPAKPAPAKTITGKVTGPDAKPLAGATVRAIAVASKDAGFRGRGPDVPKAVVAKTDAAGAFKLEVAGTGPMVLRVESPGLAPTFVPEAPPGAALSLKLKAGTPVFGRVLDLTTQKPVANATVTALERDAARFGRDAVHSVKSGEDGTFRIPDCAAGIVVVEAIAPRKARARLDKVVAKALPAGEEPKFDVNTLYLQPGGRLAGRVNGPEGKGLADAIVSLTASDGALLAMVREGRSAQRTADDGTFAFDGIVAGNKYTVRATKEGLSSREEGPIQIDAGTDRGDLELKLETGATLAFRLVTAQEVPVKDVELRLQPQGGNRRRGFGIGGNDVDRDKIVPQGDGKFQIKALDAGTFDVTLMPVDFSDVTREGVKLKSGETTDLGTLRVKESKSIAGRIADSNGQPVANASISGLSLEGEARLSREARSGADGSYRLSGLGEQPLRSLTVRATGYADANKEGAVPGDTSVDFTLEKTGSIVGRVQLRGGAAPAAFRVQAFPEAKENQERPGFRIVLGGRTDEEQIFTDPTGNFRLDGVNPGMVTVTATSDGKAPTRKSGIKVAPDQIVDAGTIILDDGRALRGRVVAAKDDAPVPGATVSVSEPQGFKMMSAGRDTAAGVAVSGLDGRFEIGGLEPRTYAVDAAQPDYSPNSGRIEISPDADTDDFVIKLSRGGSVTGLVRDAQKQALPNVSVLLTKIPMGGGPQTVSTGPDGRYTFEKIAPGEYMVIRAPTGGGPLMLFGGMKQVEVREGETTVHDLDEAAKITLTGRVLKAGQPVANSMLFFSPTTAEGPPSDLKQSRTDADGRYQIGLDAAGSYSVTVSAMRSMWVGAGSGITIQVPDQPSAVVDITVKSAGVAGRVTNGEGKPVSGAVVTVSPGEAAAGGDGGHGRRGTQDTTDPDGSFLVDGLEPGVYSVNVAAVGYRNAQPPPVTISSESDVPSLDVRLEPGRSVRGRVVDANGNGISSAWVVVAPAGSRSGRDMLPAISDVNGTFVVTAPADGAIDLTAVATGFPPARLSGVQPQEGVDVVLRSPRSGHIRVSVLDANGQPVKDARIACQAVPDFLGANYTRMGGDVPKTGTDGTATVNALGPGAYELTATLGPRTASGSVTVPEGSEVVTTVTLP